MRASGWTFFVMALTASLALPTIAAAGQPATLPVRPGQKVVVTSAGGLVTKGTVKALTPAAVELGDGLTQTSIATRDVVRIELVDSVKNGVVKGAIAGALIGSFMVAAETTGDIAGNLLSGNGDFSKVGEGGDGGFFLTIALGALLGYAIDAGKIATLYDREASGLSVGLGPIVSNASKGVGLTVRW